MSPELIILVITIVTALAFDFTNGFHDTGNAMATSIATGALQPKVAVALSGILNLVGAFLSVEVALTVTTKILKMQDKSGAFIKGLDTTTAMTIVLAGLIGGILWNLLTWLLGLPSSSSHALFGGLIGGGIAGLGWSNVKWDSVLENVLLPAVLSPVIACIVAAIGTWLIYQITNTISSKTRNSGFRWGQIGTASLVSLAHGTNDAQKTMGVIALALVAHGTLTAKGVKDNGLPLWIVFSCGLAIALGTYMGGWRIIRTLGKGLVEIESPQGMAAEASSAAIILTSSQLGMALSTTHVATGSILGSGVGKRGAQVRWNVAARMVAAWLVTLPSAAVVGALCFTIAHAIGGLAGALVVFAILLASAGYMFWHARKKPVHADNVNDEWESGVVDPSEVPAVSLSK